RFGIHLDFDREDLVGVWRQVEIEQEARKADECVVDRPLVVELDLHPVASPLQVGFDGPEIRSEIVAAIGALQGEVEIFGVAPDRIEEPERRTALKRQWDHRPGALQGGENTRLEVLPEPVLTFRRSGDPAKLKPE